MPLDEPAAGGLGGDGSLGLGPDWRQMWGGDEGTVSADRLAAVYGWVNVIASSIAAMPPPALPAGRGGEEAREEAPAGGGCAE